MFGLQRKDKAEVVPIRGLRAAMAAAEHTQPHYGLGHPPIEVIDPETETPEPPSYHDDEDPTSLVKNIQWLMEVVGTFDNALARRQQAHEDAIAKAELAHATEVNKLTTKRIGYQQKLDEKLSAFASIARSLGLTADDLRQVTERQETTP